MSKGLQIKFYVAKLRIGAIIIILFTVLSIACQMKIDTSKKKGMKKIKTALVKKDSISVKLEEIGEIKPLKKIEIKSLVSGKILKYYADEGDFVNKGDLIANIEPDYNQAEQISRVKNNLVLAKIKLGNKKKDLADMKKLADKNYASSNDLDKAVDALKEAQINYDSAVQQSNLIKDIETEGNVTKLYASASGTIIERPIEEGEMVVSSSGSYSNGTVIVKLADLKRMLVLTKISEIDIAKIHKGQRVNVSVDAYPYKKYKGIITKIAIMATTFNNVKVFPVEIEISNVDSKLKPGMTANVSIIGKKKKDILTVPIRAIFTNEDGDDIVYKVVQDSISGEVKVKTGLNDFQKVEIIEGVKEGTKIALNKPAKNDDKKKRKRK